VKKYFFLLLALAGCGQPKQQLNLFIWSEYIDPSVIQDFEQKFDCRVNVDFYEDPDSMIAKLAAGGMSRYDIVVPSDTTLPSMVKRGLLAPLRHENIPNLKHLDPRFSDAPFDAGCRFGAPLDWGTAGIYLRKSALPRIEASWGLIFDPAKQAPAFLLIEDARVCIGAALRYLGYSLNSTNASELTAARDLLIKVKHRSLGFEGGTGCKNRVLAKGAAMAMAYNADATRGMKEDAETMYVLPGEGTQIFVDVLSIPARAPHRDLAEAFINYLLEPEVSAKFANLGQCATTSKAALAFINPTDLKNTAIYPAPAIMAKLEYARDLGQQNRLYDEIWTQIKAK
jgi:spermidine/putrescine transport system substrate-binding protein